MGKKPVPAIRPSTFEAIVSPWLTGITQNQEITAIISYPSSDRQRRILNVLTDTKIQQKYLKNPAYYLWITIDFRIDHITEVSDIESVILSRISERTGFQIKNHGNFEDKLNTYIQSSGKQIVLVAFGGETLIDTKNSAILIWMTMMCRLNILHQLVFFESNIFSRESMDLIGSVRSFQPKILFMKLYDKEDVIQFIHHMSLEWHIPKIKPEIIDGITSQCGGLLLLVKEALRCVRDNPTATITEITDHIEMQFNLSMFWNGLGKIEQELLILIVKNESIDFPKYMSSVDYLQRVGLIEKIHTKLTITVPLLVKYIRYTIGQNVRLAIQTNDNITLNETPITNQFSKTERKILQYLINKPDALVNRNELFQIVWGDVVDSYSDWAIDSHISRLRKKLENLGLSPTILETKKKLGVIFHTIYE